MNEKITITSTHTDSHGEKMTPEAIEEVAGRINGTRKMMLTVEHVRELPPIGKVLNAEIIKDIDGELFVVAEQKLFDKREIVLLNGVEYFKEYYSKDSNPFVIDNEGFPSEITLMVDKVNFKNYDAMNDFYADVDNSAPTKFNRGELIRKSETPETTIVILLSQLAAYSIFLKLIKGVSEKIIENISEDTSSIYKFLREIVINSYKHCVENKKKISYIITVNGDLNLEFICITNSPERLVNAYKKMKENDLHEKINNYIKIFDVEKMQFIYSDNNVWELNYMLTSKGEVIGRRKKFKERDRLYNIINKDVSIQGAKRLKD